MGTPPKTADQLRWFPKVKIDEEELLKEVAGQ